ncbi:MAG: amidohydrolase [Candidatus Woesearchaeota archaeon]
MSILIKNAIVFGKVMDILIEDNLISRIAPKLSDNAEYTIDASHKAVIPGLFNSHTHAAMTLLRGYADDMQLQSWLQTKIWPLEAKLTDKDVYLGARLACLEMIKTGTTFFNDMYWHLEGTVRAVEEMGIRAALSYVFIDLFDEKKAVEQIRVVKRQFEPTKQQDSRVTFALGPHAIYTVSKDSLQWVADFAKQHDVLIHIHLAETKKEVDDCLKSNGKRPVQFLEDIGFLGPNVIACHSVWLTDEEIRIMARHQVKVVHNPVSNMKLAVGEVFPYSRFKAAGVLPCLGTDGCASNNSLDMFQAMKFAALLQKFCYKDPTVLPAHEAFEMATSNPALAFRINSGKIEEGKLADLLLIDLKNVKLTPNHNMVSNLVYSADGSCVDTVICDGKILMEHRVVENEEKIVDDAARAALDLVAG